MEKLLDVSAVADLLGIQKISVYSLVHRNQIPHVKLSRRMLRFRESDIAEWVAQKARDCNAMTQKGKKTLAKLGFGCQSSIDAIVTRVKKEVLEAK